MSQAQLCKSPSTNQSGRSMVEMLGVLAIIGVLTIGGLAGYSAAMTNHKANKEMEQINQVYTGIKTLCASKPLLECLGTTNHIITTEVSNTLINSGYAPEEMVHSDGFLYNPWQAQLGFQEQYGGKRLQIISNVSPAACKKMITSGIEKMGKDVFQIDTGYGSSGGNVIFNRTATISSGLNLGQPGMDKIADACAEDKINSSTPGKILFSRLFDI